MMGDRLMRLLIGWFCVYSVSSQLTDMDDLSLNYNQIKRLTGSFNSKNLLKAVNFAVDSTERSKFHENQISIKAKVEKGTISHAQLIESMPDDQAKEIDYVARDLAKASSYLLNMYCKNSNVSNRDCVKFMSKYSPPETSRLAKKCLETKFKYSSYRRILPASYRDAIQKPRAAHSGKDLPLPRVISNVLFTSGLEYVRQLNEHKAKAVSDEGVLNEKLSLSLPQWSHFIEHDLSKSVTQSLKNGNPIECCDRDHAPVQPRYLHESCLQLFIPSDDSFYKTLRVTCLNYVRSALALNSECKFGGIDQLNQATSRLDLSQLYGTDKEVQENLRSLQGRLLTSADDDLLLPTTSNDICFTTSDNSTCYQSGDSRVNVNPLVTSLYTLFLRSHNRIASKLLKTNPTLSNDQLFNITKDINVAIYQRIIYNDWANVVLGKQMALEIRNTNDDHDGKHVKSDRVSNEFGSAAIKFYNTLLPGKIMSQQEEVERSYGSENIIQAAGIGHLKKKEILKLQESFYKPRNLNKNLLLDQLMNTALRQNAMEFDSSYVEALSLQLYQSKMQSNKVFGGDSLAFDIQRSRDHGLQPYIKYLKKCFNIRITQWDDLRNIVKEDDLNKLRAIYESVNDIDLLVGGLSEVPRENVTVGQTFACILSEQLISSKISDEKFYTRRHDEIGEKIMETIKNYSAARFICDNTKLEKVQRNIFNVPSDENPLIDCSDHEKLPKLDLSYWLNRA